MNKNEWKNNIGTEVINNIIFFAGWILNYSTMSILDDDSSNQTRNLWTQEFLEEYVQGKAKIEKYDIIALYIPVFLSALIANCLVILVVIKDQYMRRWAMNNDHW